MRLKPGSLRDQLAAAGLAPETGAAAARAPRHGQTAVGQHGPGTLQSGIRARGGPAGADVSGCRGGSATREHALAWAPALKHALDAGGVVRDSQVGPGHASLATTTLHTKVDNARRFGLVDQFFNAAVRPDRDGAAGK
ncbi:hypothetical protein EYW47_22430 [Paraburkholderia silviterrae]|uniref:Uncharacterized protein n=1 Tax=Paraburkholderia silviterrae TaxID=2528715 RepID=A0A4R5M6R3_9BURK|nr:hypothetical protein EYW47_22430 [Paraburkholderia silviterrae]